MEEKKKRWRPSLTAYRELEGKLADQIEGTSRLVKDCDLWREKYRTLFKEYGKLKKQFQAGGVVTEADYNSLHVSYKNLVEKYDEEVSENRRLNDENRKLHSKIYDLDLSHTMMADELNKLRAEIAELSESEASAKKELEYLRNRSFWNRLFNK